MRYEDLTRKIIGAALEVHMALGNAAAGITVALKVEQQEHELVTNCDRFEKLKHGFLLLMFQLSKKEWDGLQSQIATAKLRSLPYVFTEHG